MLEQGPPPPSHYYCRFLLARLMRPSLFSLTLFLNFVGFENFSGIWNINKERKKKSLLLVQWVDDHELIIWLVGWWCTKMSLPPPGGVDKDLDPHWWNIPLVIIGPHPPVFVSLLIILQYLRTWIESWNADL